MSSFKNKQISETHESVGITRKQYQYSVCSQTRGIIKHKQWCCPCNNACIENTNLSPTPVSYQYANVLKVYKECEGGINEHNYECACGRASLFSMCLLVCMKYVYAHVHFHYVKLVNNMHSNASSLLKQAMNGKKFTMFTKQKHQ